LVYPRTANDSPTGKNFDLNSIASGFVPFAQNHFRSVRSQIHYFLAIAYLQTKTNWLLSGSSNREF
jgi:hypothetical protein